ncbi:MAG: hypothetical protein JSR97_07060 [Verrucomicrobia bacterium]|nr:hypothetical protein [Verrucomicrobiota bacterium]
MSSLIGENISIEQATEQFNRFHSLFTPEIFPKAVCYRLDELIKFVANANEVFKEKEIPMEERGIALTLGIHTGNRPYALNKVTIMLIPTQYVEDDPKEGKVNKINNPLVSDWPNDPPTIDNGCYDAASLWP